MSDILDLGLSDDDLLTLVVSDHEESNASRKKSKKRRPKRNDKFLEKSFKFRTIMKWKFNYLEKNPYEYQGYGDCVKGFKVHPRSFDFKKKFRLHMDDEYDYNMNLITKRLLEKEIAALELEEHDNDSGIHPLTNRTSESSATSSNASTGVCQNPVKFLINYDREVKRITKEIDKLYDIYEQFPKCYPKFAEEKDRFMKQFGDVKLEAPVDKDYIEKEFVKYWSLRLPLLRMTEIDNNKEELRMNWDSFVPSNEGLVEDLETLLISDDDDDDCMIIE